MKRQNEIIQALKTVIVSGLFTFYGCSSASNDPVSSATPKDTTLTSEEVQLLTLVNTVRQSGCECGTDSMPPVNPLKWNRTLASVAKLHSEDMVARNYFSHTTPDSVTFSQRITNGGYSWSACGENIASGQMTAESVIAAWKNSPGHCKNMMNGTYTEMGVGRSANLWTQVFARPR